MEKKLKELNELINLKTKSFGDGKNGGCGCSNNYLNEQKAIKKWLKDNQFENKFEIKKIRETNIKNESFEFIFEKTGNYGKWELNKVLIENIIWKRGVCHHVQNKKNGSWFNVEFCLVEKK